VGKVVSKRAHATSDDLRRTLSFGRRSTGQDVGVQNLEAIQEDLEGVHGNDNPGLNNLG